MTGQVKPALLRDVERSIAEGELRDSLLAPVVLEALREQTELALASPYDPFWKLVFVTTYDPSHPGMSHFGVIRWLLDQCLEFRAT